MHGSQGLYSQEEDRQGVDAMAYADDCFIRDCERILKDGVMQQGEVRPRWEDGSPAYTKKVFAQVNRYDLSKEFPILTLKPVPLHKAVDELLWIWQKKSNRVAELNSRIWDAWAMEDGSIGKAYGYQLGQKHRYQEGLFDQVDRALHQLLHAPESRRIICHMYNFEDLHAMALYPCAYSMTLQVAEGRLNGLLNQRSQDMLVANGWNVTQYAVLLHMFARHAKLAVGELVHVVADAHLYDRHWAITEDLIQREVFPAPRLCIDPDVQNFYDFRPESFQLENYHHGPVIRGIPIAV